MDFDLGISNLFKFKEFTNKINAWIIVQDSIYKRSNDYEHGVS